MLLRYIGDALDAFADLFVAFQQLDGVEATYGGVDGIRQLGGYGLHSGLNSLGERHAGRSCFGDQVSHGGNKRVNTFAFQRRDFNDIGRAQLLTQHINVNGVAVFAHNVHHVDGYQNGKSQVKQLRGQVQVAFQVGAVNDVDNGVGALVDDEFTCNNFFKRVGRKRIDARKVNNLEVLVGFAGAFFLFNGNARPVTDALV